MDVDRLLLKEIGGDHVKCLTAAKCGGLGQILERMAVLWDIAVKRLLLVTAKPVKSIHVAKLNLTCNALSYL